ncbi:50S ribosomal protein L9 [Smittium culicis]|uniref:50S ribosomal protein L9, chloroplastic n=2 Tax=Smittium culicis TaxID=133412 RepID=A0A1R1YTR1_9FUNG|nr:50S ribosomal protein L9 [Smittium culicis]
MVASMARNYSSRKAKIEIKLLERVKFLGEAGAVVAVKPGFMRRVLYPQRSAVYVDRNIGPTVRAVAGDAAPEQAVPRASTKSKFAEMLAASKPDVSEISSRLSGITSLVFARKLLGSAGDTGSGDAAAGEELSNAIYGSVNKNDIVTLLRNSHDVSITKEMLECEERFKATGDYKITVNLDSSTKCELTLTIKPN